MSLAISLVARVAASTGLCFRPRYFGKDSPLYLGARHRRADPVYLVMLVPPIRSGLYSKKWWCKAFGD